MTHRVEIADLVEEFAVTWSQSLRPGIRSFLNRIADSDRAELTRCLIRTDVEKRFSVGESPCADDYSELGSVAVSAAAIRLAENAASASGETLTKSRGSEEIPQAATRVGSRDQTHVGNPHADPSEIGPYRLVRQIGKGGMGTVWMAEQEEPVRRTVAIKLIRGDIDYKGAMARFDAERQALAMMEHPNIARVLDAGATESGVPYFVMEYVQGVRFDTYCDKHKLGIRERLELMVPICRAVQHAHHKGIVHRDLKDSNILVAESDGQPVPKVIDFGLAKALENRTVGKESIVTGLGEVVGTLQYMSPEQACGEAIDTRTDVYSLGAVLYKLLTGTTPIRKETIKSQSFVRTLESIRAIDTVRPSSRIELLVGEEALTILQARKQKGDKLVQLLRGDLDWIVMKALEKEPSCRYETANSIAREIERYLNDEEVAARPPSGWYRIQKFVKRNRGLVTTLAVFLAMLVIGVVGTSSALVWALNERDRANASSDEAKQQTTLALKAEQEARDSEARRMTLQTRAEAQLHAIRMKSAWSDWQMGSAESAWRMLNSLESEVGWETRFLRNEFVSSDQVLYGHSLPVMDVAVSNDGRLIATAGADHSVRVWDAKTRTLRSRQLLPGMATSVEFSPDSSHIACGDRSNHVSLWKADGSGKAKVFGPFPRDVACIAFLGEDSLLAGETVDDNYREGASWKKRNAAAPVIRMLDVETGKESESLSGHPRSLSGLAGSSDGSMFVSSSLDGSLRLWKLKDGAWQAQVLLGHTQGVLGVAVAPSGKTIASCGQDKTVRVWNADTGELAQTIVAHDEPVTSVAFSSDGARLVTGSEDRTARLWNLAGEEQRVCRGHFGTVTSVQFCDDGDEIVTASLDHTARVWDANSSRGNKVWHPHGESVWAGSFSPDGQTVVTVSEDGLAVRTDVVTGREVGRTRDEQALLAVSWSPTENYFVTAGEGLKLTVRDGTTGLPIRQVAAHSDLIWDLSFSPDGKWLASASSDKTAQVWNTTDWSVVATLSGHTGEVASARFSPEGGLLATASDDQSIKLWDTTNFQLLETLKGHSHAVWRAVFSPDGKQIASSSYNGELMLWDTGTREPIKTIQGHSNQVAGLAFSRDGSRLVSASDDRTIKIWDLKSGVEYFVMRDQDDKPIIYVGFSPDGTKLVSGNSTGWVTIRSAADAASQPRPFLPEDSVAATINTEAALTDQDLSEHVLRELLAQATQSCEFFPTFHSWSNRGIAEFRLGMNEQAINSLVEARRLEPIEYGEPDVPPLIEGYLTLAYIRAGKATKANEAHVVFQKKRSIPLWSDDPALAALAERIEIAMRSDL